MIVRFGYVAMSMELQNASPSKTMTMTTFSKLNDRDAALRRLERLAAENLHNTLRLLKHNRYMDVKVYRFTSKLIPLVTHELLNDWDPYPVLAEGFADVGSFVREHHMRVSFHPDHFTVLSTPRADVFRKSVTDLHHHVMMLEAMGLDERATCNIHVGGSYGNKETAVRRFIENFGSLEKRIAQRITLENDDKTFTAEETLNIAEEVGAPMVLDLHHDAVNPSDKPAEQLWPRIMDTWNKFGWNGIAESSDRLPPKMHISSPKSEKDPRGHADYVDPEPLLRFLYAIAGLTPAVDIMIEAKQKDAALLKLMEDMRAAEASGQPVRVIDGATVEVLG
ncbi:UV damage repair endonuclease UvdE [Cohnella kolymensis]|uniref:UV damage repair endonuclease UvdE n=1 Tax=Cohnella kolymensis TaxID=1590652 RepID=A0ABR5A9W8_9BACL|nr:UV DNA damage repair endonuclease UvsE [Cohnella kolymensis]KIL37405.1 UV damage repair endonuclease UvdE [Cohnella kolymensis]